MCPMFTPNIIAPHGGYKNLKSFQNAEIVYDLTVEFCNRYVYGTYRTYKTYRSYRTADQMVQAARSGTRNISEGSQTSGTSKQSELRLMDVARASFAELLDDYKSFLRQNNLAQWSKDDERSLAIRQLAYKSDRSYMTYLSYLSDAESAANCAICLINQTAYLLDNQLRVLAKELSAKGDLNNRLKAVSKTRFFIDPIDANYDGILKQNGMRRLQNGRVVALNDPATE